MLPKDYKVLDNCIPHTKLCMQEYKSLHDLYYHEKAFVAFDIFNKV